MSAREVSLTGGSPWGFRMHGGCDQHQPLRISRVSLAAPRETRLSSRARIGEPPGGVDRGPLCPAPAAVVTDELERPVGVFFWEGFGGNFRWDVRRIKSGEGVESVLICLRRNMSVVIGI